MPTKLDPKEANFLRRYVKEGAVEEKIPAIEKRLRLRVGTGVKFLKLKRVQDALRVMMEPIRLEQERQAMVGKAVEECTAKLQAEKAELEARLAAATQMPDMRVTGNTEAIEHELMRLVRLDPERHGGIKLASIKTALVVAGLMEQGTTRRVIPPDDPGKGTAPGIYQSLFDRQRQQEKLLEGNVTPPPPALPPAEEAEVFDLTPQAAIIVPRGTKGESELPKEGESIDPVVVAAPKRQPSQKAAAQVITVEVG